MRRLFLSFLVLTLTLPALAQAKHPFTFDDMMKLKRVGEPVISPDGKWVIFSVVDVDLEANTKTPHIWIVPTAGSEEKSGDQKKSGARDLAGGTEHVIAVAGDGAFTNGITFEALNNISEQTKRMIVVLNDNEWSIDRKMGIAAR